MAANCTTKRRYSTVVDALRAIARGPTDPYLEPYYCADHHCLHVGHGRFWRRYNTWDAAFQAVQHVHARQTKPRRMRILKQDDAWVATWAPRAETPALQAKEGRKNGKIRADTTEPPSAGHTRRPLTQTPDGQE